MNQNQLTAFAQLEADLWEAADQLRANSKLTSSEYCMPVLGVIFLRHAANRFEAATRQIEEDQASGRMPKRPLIKDDYIKRRALYLPEDARYDSIMALPKEEDLDLALVDAMTAIEKAFEPLIRRAPQRIQLSSSAPSLKTCCAFSIVRRCALPGETSLDASMNTSL